VEIRTGCFLKPTGDIRKVQSFISEMEGKNEDKKQ
jgi:hypothetical protein